MKTEDKSYQTKGADRPARMAMTQSDGSLREAELDKIAGGGGAAGGVIARQHA
jgi:hypothetical protein